jgi:hypothetical protein
VSEGYQREIWILEGQVDVTSEGIGKLTFEYVFDIQTTYQKKFKKVSIFQVYFGVYI